jgi:hypothetical protein
MFCNFYLVDVLARKSSALHCLLICLYSAVTQLGLLCQSWLSSLLFRGLVPIATHGCVI